MKHLIDSAAQLNKDEFITLLQNRTPRDAAYAAEKARALTDEVFGREVYMRGLIEVSSICKNDCYYCGIRRSNRHAQRYRLNKEQILACCEAGYRAGFRTFVLQGGEDPYYTDEVLTDIVSTVRRRYPDCAITLSMGERSGESYRRLYEAGANRYLLRHETALPAHYAKLHPAGMDFDNRMACLHALKSIGYQTGCGMMVGSPYQTAEALAEDLLFIRSFRPHMVGMGPFIPHRDTPFAGEKTGSVELTLFLISLVRLMLPKALIPATTALQTLLPEGRILGLNAGANVIMPNLTPEEDRAKYSLYDNKENAFSDAAGQLKRIETELSEHGYILSRSRGDYDETKNT